MKLIDETELFSGIGSADSDYRVSYIPVDG